MKAEGSRKWKVVNGKLRMAHGVEKEETRKRRERAGPGLTRGGIQFNGRNNGKGPHIWRDYG